MAIEIIRPRERVESVSRSLFFEREAARGSGFAFSCDEHGNLQGDAYASKAEREAQAAELRASGQYRAPYVQTSRSSHTLPAVGRCTCGAEVVLSDPLSNECEPCGRWYNMMGQSKINPHGELARALDAEGSY
ncbi:MAG TPA: hypothetical protein VFE72_07445 [Lysobacter sp.]|nr:hypothetical protein [Lysobacter sp.]